MSVRNAWAVVLVVSAIAIALVPVAQRHWAHQEKLERARSREVFSLMTRAEALAVRRIKNLNEALARQNELHGLALTVDDLVNQDDVWLAQTGRQLRAMHEAPRKEASQSDLATVAKWLAQVEQKLGVLEREELARERLDREEFIDKAPD